jgi:very-short-patch-repair endonuclease
VYRYSPVEQLLSQDFSPVVLEALWNYLATYHLDIQTFVPAQATQDTLLQLWYILHHPSRYLPLSNYLQSVFDKNFVCNAENTHLYFNALHIIEPRLNAVSLEKTLPTSWENLPLRFERDFLLKDLPMALGEFLEQLFEPQRSMESMVAGLPANLQQNVDYVIEFPYLIHNYKGIVIEIDGEAHLTPTQRHIDEQRNHYLRHQQWYVLRVNTEDFNMLHKILEPLKIFLQTDYGRRLSANYQSSLANHVEGLDALQLVLSPLAIGRIQQSLLACLVRGHLSLSATQWRIAVLEQDIPAAHYAIEDFKLQAARLFAIENKGRKLPEIDLTIITTRKYETAKLNKGLTKYLSADFHSATTFDVVIDLAMLQRTGQNWLGKLAIQCKTAITLRSNFYTTPNPTHNFAVYLPTLKDFFVPSQQPTVRQIAQQLAIGHIQIPTLPTLQYTDLLTFIQTTLPELLCQHHRLELLNTVWVHLALNTQASTKLLAVAALVHNFGELQYILGIPNWQEQTEKLLFEGLYELHCTNKQDFDTICQLYHKQLLAFAPPQAQNLVNQIVGKITQQLAAQPHLEWLKGFVRQFVGTSTINANL